ncbi:PepSY domain-containing protein [Rubellimicrobium roseum]|uniref:PepSY domain-containing protein n=1 Tax=Rubellimicrobium roseum TaxID=687525 RepID=A0A5C4NJG7_9RHOB|nr:PepSY domain-containing protein [Rubellimicrobium roseum]TNC74934.1 PepSY domain-containing protein [Rubellimicrobium roseum]
MPRPRLGLLAALILLPAAALAQEDDRDPTDEERARIEAALQAEGFTAWDDIELDDGLWEVEDAVAADGQDYDLRLDDSLAIVARDPDD